MVFVSLGFRGVRVMGWYIGMRDEGWFIVSRRSEDASRSVNGPGGRGVLLIQ